MIHRAFLFFTTLFMSSYVGACSCVRPYTVKDNVASANQVFVGRVLATKKFSSHPRLPGWPGVQAEVEVVQNLKGNSQKRTTIITGKGNGACGVPMRTGMSYVFFVSEKHKISISDGTREYVKDHIDSEQYVSEIKSYVTPTP
jgi:hypothetical protein